MDPFGERDAVKKRAALDNAGLKALRLDHAVGQDGSSLSAGFFSLEPSPRALPLAGFFWLLSRARLRTR